jgi:hypothetical protein
LSLDQLARELGVHVRTLRAPHALVVSWCNSHRGQRSVGRFGCDAIGRSGLNGAVLQTILFADGTKAITSRHACAVGLCRSASQVRRTLRLTQGQFAEAIGAANKAVVYQWESKKRTSSPVFWQTIERLVRIA